MSDNWKINEAILIYSAPKKKVKFFTHLQKKILEFVQRKKVMNYLIEQ